VGSVGGFQSVSAAPPWGWRNAIPSAQSKNTFRPKRALQNLLLQQNRPLSSDIAAQPNVGVQGNSRRPDESQNPTFLTDSVEKVASLKSLKNCQNTNDIFD
jgi:hypothetical protein